MGSANPDRPAATVGDLVLRRWLAQGGMAELYLATPADPARASEVVVLKRVLPQFSSSSNFVRMFAREARLASMLQHPNIVGVHDTVGPAAGDCFFTMEYVHGVDLGHLLEELRSRGGALPLAHALTIAVAICAGLHHAHEARDANGRPLGIVHRDVSPSNVLLGFDGAIKVTDFGVAKAMALTRLTEEGTRKGKLCYMSPEQATGEAVDRRADVFAIATVLYELTTMERLFGGDNDLAVMYNLMTRPRPSPRAVSPGYPAALEAIVMRGVAASVDDRFPTALALQQALEEFAAAVGLVLSMDAVGAFVRQTMPVPVHPREDPEFLASTVVLRGPPQHVITSVHADDRPDTEAEARAPAPTGPNPSIPIEIGSYGTVPPGTGPHGAVLSGTGPHGAVPPGTGPHGAVPPGTGPHGAVPPGTGPHGAAPLMTGPHGAAPMDSLRSAPIAGASFNSGSVQSLSGSTAVPPTGAWAPAPAPPSTLHKWSLVLAMIALLAAVGTGVMVWQSNRGVSAESTPAAEPVPVSAPAAPAVPKAEPGPVAEPSPSVAPDQPESTTPAAAPPDPETPSKRKKGKRRTKKRTPIEPEPTLVPTEPTSKKPSPTDTLLPIRK